MSITVIKPCMPHNFAIFADVSGNVYTGLSYFVASALLAPSRLRMMCGNALFFLVLSKSKGTCLLCC